MISEVSLADPTLAQAPPPGWEGVRLTAPSRHPVIGVPVSVTDYDEAVAATLTAARAAVPFLVTALAVHGVVEACTRPDMGRAIAGFDVVTPDGQPVRHALNLLQKRRLRDRVYGPTLMLRLCAQAAREGLPIYLYGSTEAVVEKLAAALQARFPGLVVAGREPSVFRPLEPQERRALAARIRASGARLVFIGLGCPRQELFAWENRDLIGLPQICVGAAFDFHAGNKRQAPRWMQDLSLEWLFRLSQEPRRLFRRYAYTNSVFLLALARQLLGTRRISEDRT
nr:glycosyltransferase [Cereibacter sphaeroides f. sp. denitrificans]